MPTQYKKNYIVFHHTLTDRDTTTFESVNNYHKNLWNFKSSLGYYIGYHYFITGDGKVTQGRSDWEAGAHTSQENKNYDSIGICLTGNFDNQQPSTAQLDSLRKLIQDLMSRYSIPFENLKFHREYATYKSCPGNNIKNDFFINLLKQTNDMLKLVRQSNQNEVYAIDKNNRRHSICNWDTFQKGLAMGLWENDIKVVDSLTQYPLSDMLILVTDN